MKPTVVRAVHFHHQLRSYAATITNVLDDTTVDLVVFDFMGQAAQIKRAVVFDGNDHPVDHTWSWPPKIAA